MWNIIFLHHHGYQNLGHQTADPPGFSRPPSISGRIKECLGPFDRPHFAQLAVGDILRSTFGTGFMNPKSTGNWCRGIAGFFYISFLGGFRKNKLWRFLEIGPELVGQCLAPKGLCINRAKQMMKWYIFGWIPFLFWQQSEGLRNRRFRSRASRYFEAPPCWRDDFGLASAGHRWGLRWRVPGLKSLKHVCMRWYFKEFCFSSTVKLTSNTKTIFKQSKLNAAHKRNHSHGFCFNTFCTLQIGNGSNNVNKKIESTSNHYINTEHRRNFGPCGCFQK